MATAELILDAHAELAEGPVWLGATGELLWVDIEPGDVHWLDPRTGADRSVNVGAPVGAALPDETGGLVLALPLRLARLAAGSTSPELIVAIPDEPDIRMNDAACDRRGRLFVGSVAEDESTPRGTLYRVAADLQPVPVLHGLTISNGIDWSPDDTRMYFVDSTTRRVDVLDYDIATGETTSRRPFHRLSDDLPGMPDGLCVDAEGSVWVAVWGGSRVLGIGSDGTLHSQIDLPASQVTSCAFGGDDLRTLFITSAAVGLDGAEPRAGGLFTADVGVAGLATTAFAG